VRGHGKTGLSRFGFDLDTKVSAWWKPSRGSMRAELRQITALIHDGGDIDTENKEKIDLGDLARGIFLG
jgi:hypothetical protein